MKVHLIFQLPEEKVEYDVAMNAHNYASLIYQWTTMLRDKTKYAPTDKDLETNWDNVKDAWWNLLKEAGIDPYES